MFVEELQKEIDNCLPEVMKGVERHIRVLPVSEGGMGLTDFSITRRAARKALLVQTGTEELTEEEKEMVQLKKGEGGKDGLQRRLTTAYRNAILEEQKHTMVAGAVRKTKRFVTCPTDSLWLAQPPLNPSQVLSDLSFKLAVAQRYGLEPFAKSTLRCPFCKALISTRHYLACMRANAGPIVNRHNTISRMIGSALATQGVTAEYEKKPVMHTKETIHIPDVSYIKDTEEHHIDVTVCSAHAKGNPLHAAQHKKAKQYEIQGGQKLKNLHVVIFDNAARMGEGVYSYLRSVGCTNAIIKAMQIVVLRSNERCYTRVMRRLAEEKNTCRRGGLVRMMASPNQIDDMLSLY